MKRWGLDQKNETTVLPKSHVVLGVLAMIGFGMILISLAGPVFSTTPTPVGHDLSELGDGTASGTVSSVYSFPGTIFGNLIKVGAGVVSWELYTTAGYLGLRNSSIGNPTVLTIS
ncbi:MAG: hypothetical protein AABX02_05410, partial [archaeon]